MPLPPPAAPRQQIHRRDITCTGYRRADGLWDIEGHLLDRRDYPFENQSRGVVPPGEPVHEMWVRLTVDDRLEVRAVDVATDHAPFPVCPAILPNFQRLVGLRIASGWTAAVKERLGGVQGCTHLVELLGPVATSAFQTIGPLLDQERQASRTAARARGEALPPYPRPPVINTCHALISGSEAVRHRWPEWEGENTNSP